MVSNDYLREKMVESSAKTLLFFLANLLYDDYQDEMWDMLSEKTGFYERAVEDISIFTGIQDDLVAEIILNKAKEWKKTQSFKAHAD